MYCMPTKNGNADALCIYLTDTLTRTSACCLCQWSMVRNSLYTHFYMYDAYDSFEERLVELTTLL